MQLKSDAGKAVMVAVFAFVYRLTGLRLENGDPIMAGIDAWYHLRAVRWSMEHWPSGLSYDPWTAYPQGHTAGQFGTIYDIALAGIALLIETVFVVDGAAWVVAIAPAVLLAGTVLVVYAIADELGGKHAGLVAAIAVAVVPGVFMQRTMAGFGDHHSVEIFLQAVSALCVMRMYNRQSRFYAILAGVVLWIYMLIWPPAAYFVGIIGLTALIVFTIRPDNVWDHERDNITLSMVLFMLLLFSSFSLKLSTTEIGLLHILITIGLAVLAVASRVSRGRISGLVFTGSILTIGAFTVTVVATIPRGANVLYRLASRVTPLQLNHISMIAEAQSVTSALSLILQSGLLVPIAGMGAYYLLRKKRNTEVLFAVTWLAVAFEMSLAQVRFHYYLAVPAAVVAGAASIHAARETSLARPVLAAAIVLAAIGPGIGMALGSAEVGHEQHERWGPALEYLESNAKDPGIEYTGEPWSQTDQPCYAVMAWWDYGHWLLEDGRVPVVANPMQANAPVAANFLAAPNESAAMQALPEDVKYVVVGREDVRDNMDAIVRWSKYDTRLSETYAVQLYNGTGSDKWELVFSENGVRVFKQSGWVGCEEKTYSNK